MNLFDSSALLAFLQGESGADAVEEALQAGGSCGAASWSETAQKTRQRGGDWSLARGLLESYGLTVEPVNADDAVRAAVLWGPGSPLSLADRLCLAPGTDWTPPSGRPTRRGDRPLRSGRSADPRPSP